MYATVHDKSKALTTVRREWSQIQRDAPCAFLLKERKCVEDFGRYLARDGICVLLKHQTDAVESAEAALTLVKLICGV